MTNVFRAFQAGRLMRTRSNALVTDWIKDKTVAEVVQILEQAEVPVGPVHSVPQAARDPHLWEREMLVEIEDKEKGHTYVPGLTVKFSDTPGKIVRFHNRANITMRSIETGWGIVKQI